MTPTETSELQLERDGVIRSSAWLGAGVELASAPDPMEGKRCISCGKFVLRKYWHLPKDDVNGCGLRPLCYECA
jgi:hypothetical protein